MTAEKKVDEEKILVQLLCLKRDIEQTIKHPIPREEFTNNALVSVNRILKDHWDENQIAAYARKFIGK